MYLFFYFSICIQRSNQALRSLVQVEGADEVLLPVLPKILEEFSRIMSEIGNDEVISALQKIINQFGDHIEPHAVVLVNQLCTAFSSFFSEGADDDDAVSKPLFALCSKVLKDYVLKHSELVSINTSKKAG